MSEYHFLDAFAKGKSVLNIHLLDQESVNRCSLGCVRFGECFSFCAYVS